MQPATTLQRCGVLAALCLWAALAGPAGGQAVNKGLTLPEAGDLYALDPETGGLATVLAGPDRVVLYPKVVTDLDTGKAVSAKVGTKPVAILFKKLAKGSVFAVLCPGGRELWVLDAASLRVRHKVALTLNDARLLLASTNPHDPCVYYCTGNGHDCRIAAVDVEAGADLGALSQESVADGAISADGSLLYFRGPFGPTGFQAWEIVKKDGTVGMRRVSYEHSGTWGYLPDPFGQYVVANGFLWSPHLDKKFGPLPTTPQYAGLTKIGETPMAVQLISAVHPVMLGIKDGRLTAVSVNTLRVVGSAPVPIPLFKFDPVHPNVPAADGVPVWFFEAPKQGRIVLCRGDRVAVVAYDVLDRPDEPFLAVTVQGPRDASVGRRLVLRLVPKDPAVKLALREGPPGMELAGKELVWTPAEDQIGSHRVIVQASAKNIEKATELSVAVRRPSLEVPFPVSQLVVDERGETALVSGADDPNEALPPRKKQVESRDSRLALVDVKAVKVMAQRTLPVAIGDVALDAHYAYAALADSDALLVLDRKDLKDVKRLFTNGRVTSILPVADSLLFVQAQTGPMTVLKVPALEPAGPADVGLGIHLSAKGSCAAAELPAQAAGRDIWFDGILYDAALKKPVQVVRPRGVSVLTPDGLVPPATRPERPAEEKKDFGADEDPRFPPQMPAETRPPPVPDWLAPWGVTVTGPGARQGKRLIGNLAPADKDNGPKKGNVIGLAALVLPDQPAVATLRARLLAQDKPDVALLQAELRFHDLIDATPRVEMKLQNDSVGDDFRFDPTNRDKFTQFVTRPGALIALVGRRLHVVPVPKLDPARFAPTMHYVPGQPVPVLSDQDATIALPKLAGAKGPVEVRLRQEIEGAELDKAGEKLRLHPQPLMARAADDLAAVLTRDPGASAPGVTADQALATYLREAGGRFEKVTGGKAKGVPVWLALGVIAQDRNQQTAEADVGLFLDVPEALVRARLKALTARPPGTDAAGKGGDAPALLKRIDQLERRLDEMNRKMDLLLRVLGVPPDQGPPAKKFK
jgi:hypothetical protein